MVELILVSSQSGSLPGASGISVSVFSARRRSAGVSPAALLHLYPPMLQQKSKNIPGATKKAGHATLNYFVAKKFTFDFSAPFCYAVPT